MCSAASDTPCVHRYSSRVTRSYFVSDSGIHAGENASVIWSVSITLSWRFSTGGSSHDEALPAHPKKSEYGDDSAR